MEYSNIRLNFFQRFDAKEHTDITLTDMITLVRTGQLTLPDGTRAPFISQHQSRDLDHLDINLQQIQHVHRERLKNGYKTPKNLYPIKERMPLVALGTTFRQGGKAAKDVLTVNPIGQLDIDDHSGQAFQGEGTTLQELVDRIVADPHTLAAYTTISRGLRVIFAYEQRPEATTADLLDDHRAAWAVADRHYSQLLNLTSGTDPKVKTPTQLAALAYDPQAFLNPCPTPFTAAEISNERKQQHKSKNTKIQQHKNKVRARERITPLFEQVIRPLLEQPKDPARPALVFEPGHHNDYVSQLAYLLNRYGIAEEVALEWTTARFADDYPQTAAVVQSVYRNHTDEHATLRQPRLRKTTEASAKAPVPTVDDIKHFLTGAVSLRFNEITRRVEALIEERGEGEEERAFTPITDRMVNTLWRQMGEQGWRVRVDDIRRVIESDYVKPFNPFRHYLASFPLPLRGGRGGASEASAIRALAATVTVKGGPEAQQLWTVCLRKWLVAMVAGWLEADRVNQTVLVLIGPQGAYKTTWLRSLLPAPLQPYFYTKTDSSSLSKDDKLSLTQYGLVCLEELDTMTNRDLNQLKSAVTTTHIDERPAYGHFHEHLPRIASFCGTGNQTQFLTDQTGNRRWLPFEVLSIEPPHTTAVDRDAVFAEAYALYRQGFRYWFERNELTQLNRHNQQFETPRLEQELVLAFFRKPLDHEAGTFTTVARAIQLMGYNLGQKLSPIMVGRAFRELGFSHTKKSGINGYIAILRSNDEMRVAEQISVLSPDNENDIEKEGELTF